MWQRPLSGHMKPAASRRSGMRAMNRIDIATLEHASRSVMAYLPEPDGDRQIMKLVSATVPALGILAACLIVLVGIV
jgi:hypothetical protein